MKILKYLLMIVTAPVILVLTLFVWLCMGLIYISGLVLGLLLSLIHIFHSETVAVYPGEKNNLPYDVVVERLHIEEPEPQMCIRDRLSAI